MKDVVPPFLLLDGQVGATVGAVLLITAAANDLAKQQSSALSTPLVPLRHFRLETIIFNKKHSGFFFQFKDWSLCIKKKKEECHRVTYAFHMASNMRLVSSWIRSRLNWKVLHFAVTIP